VIKQDMRHILETDLLRFRFHVSLPKIFKFWYIFKWIFIDLFV